MRCLFCDRRLGLFKAAKGAKFCSTEHEEAYWRAQAMEALERVRGTGSKQAEENSSEASGSAPDTAVAVEAPPEPIQRIEPPAPVSSPALPAPSPRPQVPGIATLAPEVAPLAPNPAPPARTPLPTSDPGTPAWNPPFARGTLPETGLHAVDSSVAASVQTAPEAIPSGPAAALPQPAGLKPDPPVAHWLPTAPLPQRMNGYHAVGAVETLPSSEKPQTEKYGLPAVPHLAPAAELTSSSENLGAELGPFSLVTPEWVRFEDLLPAAAGVQLLFPKLELLISPETTLEPPALVGDFTRWEENRIESHEIEPVAVSHLALQESSIAARLLAGRSSGLTAALGSTAGALPEPSSPQSPVRPEIQPRLTASHDYAQETRIDLLSQKPGTVGLAAHPALPYGPADPLPSGWIGQLAAESARISGSTAMAGIGSLVCSAIQSSGTFSPSKSVLNLALPETIAAPTRLVWIPAERPLDPATAHPVLGERPAPKPFDAVGIASQERKFAPAARVQSPAPIQPVAAGLEHLALFSDRELVRDRQLVPFIAPGTGLRPGFHTNAIPLGLDHGTFVPRPDLERFLAQPVLEAARTAGLNTAFSGIKSHTLRLRKSPGNLVPLPPLSVAAKISRIGGERNRPTKIRPRDFWFTGLNSPALENRSTRPKELNIPALALRCGTSVFQSAIPARFGIVNFGFIARPTFEPTIGTQKGRVLSLSVAKMSARQFTKSWTLRLNSHLRILHYFGGIESAEIRAGRQTRRVWIGRAKGGVPPAPQPGLAAFWYRGRPMMLYQPVKPREGVQPGERAPAPWK